VSAILVAFAVYVGLSFLVTPVVMAAIIVGSRIDAELMLGEARGPRSRVSAAAPRPVSSGQGITTAPTA
jgi:hypothetical protein